MSMRGGGMLRESLDDALAGLQEQDNLSDDDNAQPDLQEQEMEVEDPLLLAIDDLEGRVVTALDDVKVHPGLRTSSAPGSPSVHAELASMLRPVLEVAAHTGPSIARTYYRGDGQEGIEASVGDVYERVVSDLVLPVMLEMAQSERNPAKLGASLEFFHNFWKECHKAGSWLDSTTSGPQAGPYGAGGSHSSAANNPALKPLLQRRLTKRMTRESEILRYWVQASIACMEPGVLTSDEGEGAVASRGVIAACASLRPALRHIAQRIKNTDDRGANKLYAPVMRMVEGVFKKLFLGNPGESIRSACIKFLEVVILCFSFKPKDATSRRRGQNTGSDFSLEEIPAGHPTITREALESVSEYAFTTLRGLTLLGGQVKIDSNVLSDLLMTSGSGGTPSTQVVSMLKPAALAYLEIESNLPKGESSDGVLEYKLDRSSVEFDFLLSQKSYTLSINAVQALAVNRPVFFQEAAICIARRAVQPPVPEHENLTKPGVLAISSQLKATCLTLLRNSLSVTTNSTDILHGALRTYGMDIQAEKALSMAKQATALKTAGRAARNRANMYYEWDASDGDRVSRRQRETDDDLAKIRAAKAARGLGHGIRLPTNMSESIDLVMLNLKHLPKKRPQQTTAKSSKVVISLDYIVDAILTNGASLSQEEGNWYERDGSSAWTVDFQAENRYKPKVKFMDSFRFSFQDGGENEVEEREQKRRKIIREQSQLAATSALSRILTTTVNAKSKALGMLGSAISSRLAFILGDKLPPTTQDERLKLAMTSVEKMKGRGVDDELYKALSMFLEKRPLVATSLVAGVITVSENSGKAHSMSSSVLVEAYMQCCTGADSDDKFWQYDCALSLYICLVARAGDLANEKPTDMEQKKAAADAVSTMHTAMVSLPRLTESSILLVGALCDLDEISKKVASTQRQTSQESIAIAAATHAAKQAAEKRAKVALVILRDIAFEKTVSILQLSAVRCATGLASGRLQSNPKVQERALALVVNVLFTKTENLSQHVVIAAKEELRVASQKAIDAYDEVSKANKEAEAKATNMGKKSSLAAKSSEEKLHLDRMRGPALLMMALCLRLPELIKDLFEISCADKADVLAKAVRINMGKLAKASTAKHGKTEIALKVAEITGQQEIPLLLAFLENLAVPADRNNPDQDIIDVCYKVQDSKKGEDGTKDPRFLIPVLPYMLRNDIGNGLSSFVASDDKVFRDALTKMGERLHVQALMFREEQDEESPALRGMTLCEQLVYLHKLDFAAASLPQKRYLATIKMCLEDEEVYGDQVVMSALDHMSGTFLSRNEKLPLAFMRTCILVCSQHESLHSWICHELLPRLIDGKVYEYAKQWEGWMRCAHMLEKSGQPGVSSVAAISKLPAEQLMQYRTKWASSTSIN